MQSGKTGSISEFKASARYGDEVKIREYNRVFRNIALNKYRFLGDPKLFHFELANNAILGCYKATPLGLCLFFTKHKR